MITQHPLDIPPDLGAEAARTGLSRMARSMIGSSILKVAGEIRALREQGVQVADLTVGDFAPSEFPIPETLKNHLLEAVERGETNYPPAAGLKSLRIAVQKHLSRTQGLDYPLDGIAIVGGARPALYAAYCLLTDPGDTVVYPVPSWNNSNYQDVCRIQSRVVRCRPENAFQPTVEEIAPHVAGTRLLVLNTPQNPSGGVMTPSEVEKFGRLVVEENERRRRNGERPFYLLLDQIYRALVFPGSRHVSPVQLVPECAPYVVHVDGISKFCAATGLRLGWIFGPPAIIRKTVAFLTHVGAWAPRPVQVATASFLEDEAACSDWETRMAARVEERLNLLHGLMQELGQEGFPVTTIAPQGAIYISVRFALQGKRTPQGKVLQNNEDVRAYLLSEAAFALVPFSAFGVPEDEEDGWFRASVGAVSPQALRDSLPRLRRTLAALR